MSAFDDIGAQIAEHERAVAELRKERRGFIPELVAGAYVPDADGNWPMLKDVAKALGLSVTVVRRAIADQTPAPGDEQLLEVILQRRRRIAKTYTRISKELKISPLRVRDILARHWQQEYEKRYPASEPEAASEPYSSPLIGMVTREAVRLYRNSNYFLSEQWRTEYDAHIREWQAQDSARIGAKLRIRLPNEYSLDDYSARVLGELG